MSELPQVGAYYKSGAYTFRVDDVKNGEVYVVRYRHEDQYGVPMRVSVKVWQDEMGERHRRFRWPSTVRDEDR